MEQSNKTLTILIGCLVDDSDIQRLVSQYFKSFVSVSNLAYENKLFTGFKKAGIGDVAFLSAPIVGNYPTTSKKMIVKGFCENNSLSIVRYSCLIGYRNISKSRALRRKLREIIENSIKKYDSIHVIACEYHKPYLDCLRMAKKRYRVKTTMIVPDLPRHVGNHNPLYTFLKKRTEKKMEPLLKKYVDSFVCFTNDINSEINRFAKPYIISEGIMDEVFFCDDIKKKSNVVCTYIGKLDKNNGVGLLIEASKELPDNYSIHVYGSGEMENALNDLSTDNLIYHGFVSPDKVRTILRESDVLMSPRFPGDEYTRYSFPSKIFDYLSSGKPIVTFNLPCYFEKLSDVLTFLDDGSPRDIVGKIKTAIDEDGKRKKHLQEIYQKYNCAETAKKIHTLSLK